MWSSWRDTAHAIDELDRIVAALDDDALLPAHQLAAILAPTGPMHELAISSGWSSEFGAIADEIDAALAAAARRTEFACSLCPHVAGTVWLQDDTQVARESFTSRLSLAIAPGRIPSLQAALDTKDARALHAVDVELAPFHCPDCNASYCGEHWTRWSVFDDDGWHDSIRGRCPHGHERMLED